MWKRNLLKSLLGEIFFWNPLCVKGKYFERYFVRKRDLLKSLLCWLRNGRIVATRSPSIPPCHRAASAGSSNSILCLCPFSMFYNIYLCFLCVIVMVLEIALPVAWSIGQSVIKLDPLCLTKTFCLKPYFVMNTMFFVIFFAAAFRWYLATKNRPASRPKLEELEELEELEVGAGRATSGEESLKMMQVDKLSFL